MLKSTFSYAACKNILDVFASLVALVLLFPLFLLVYLVALSQHGSPVFFTQIRAGLHGKPFRMYKFRSMNNARSLNGMLMPDAQRLTPFGRWLRATSIDELPELLNILRGEMSFIGPRPLLMQYLPLYTPEQARRHDVKPGFSGWAQINGRNAISWKEKFKLDVWYVEHQSLWLDLRIFMLTVWKVIHREGISAAGDATMPLFRGDDDA